VLPYAEKELGFLFQPPKYLDVLISNGEHRIFERQVFIANDSQDMKTISKILKL